jgi:ligand-binding sensor domain-containing protein
VKPPLQNIVFIFQFALILALHSQLIFSQFYIPQIEKIYDESGRSPGATFDIVEDLQGFIWFGTIDGLYRFDGYNFKIYRNNLNDTNTLSNNTIRALAFDKEGLLWIGTQGGGLDCFNTKTENFTHFVHKGNRVNEISGNSIWSIMADKNDDIWIGVSGKGVNCLNKSSGEIAVINPLGGKNHFDQWNNIRDIIQDKDGNIWIGIPGNGLSCIDPEKRKIIQFFGVNNESKGLTDNMIFDIFEDSNDRLWISTFNRGVHILNKSDTVFNHLTTKSRPNGLVSDLIYSVNERIPGEYWIGTEYGISVYSEIHKKVSHYQKNSCHANSIGDNRIREIFIDSKGIVWVGSEAGVDKIIHLSHFKTYRYNNKDSDNTVDNIYRTILEDSQGDLWFGLIKNGLLHYDNYENKYTHYLHHENDPFSLPDNHINYIFEDSNENIWIGGWNHGLFKFDKNKNKFISVANKKSTPTPLTDNRIQLIQEEKPGILWIGTEYGLNRYDIKKNSIQHFLHQEDDSNSLSGNSIQSQAFNFDKDSNLWLGVWSFGLNKIEFLNNERTEVKITHWRHEESDPGSISNDNVTALHIDKNGIIWVGTFGGGLNKFDPSTNRFIHYTIDSGLPNNVIFGILEDPKGNLWLSTDFGLSCFNPVTKSFQNYFEPDGIQDNHFFWGSAHKGPSGNLYFGGINGVTCFNPLTINADTFRPNLFILDIKVQNKSIILNEYNLKKDGLILNHDENSIHIEFCAIDFRYPKNIKYKYLLEGFNNDWQQTENNRIASYTNLSPGKYIFKVKTTNSYGFWNQDNIYSLNVTIKKPWLKTILAQLIKIILLILLIIGVFKLRFKFLEANNRKLEEQVKLRVKEIEEQKILLENQTKEIEAHNEMLNKQRKLLFTKNEKLEKTLKKLEQTQSALIESEKMASLGIFTAGVAHEINNPLNFISVSVDNLRSELENIKKNNFIYDKDLLVDMFTMLKHMETGTSRILNITENLKTYVHAKRDNYEKISLKKLVRTTIQLIAPKIPPDISIEEKISKIPQIHGKKNYLSQVLINIIENAIDAIIDKAEMNDEKISISAKNIQYNDNQSVLIRISNTGPPIPEKNMKKICEPFFTTKPPNKGTGLGLYISYYLIREHKGFLEVNNSKKGVNFDIYLPVSH